MGTAGHRRLRPRCCLPRRFRKPRSPEGPAYAEGYRSTWARRPGGIPRVAPGRQRPGRSGLAGEYGARSDADIIAWRDGQFEDVLPARKSCSAQGTRRSTSTTRPTSGCATLGRPLPRSPPFNVTASETRSVPTWASIGSGPGSPARTWRSPSSGKQWHQGKPCLRCHANYRGAGCALWRRVSWSGCSPIRTTGEPLRPLALRAGCGRPLRRSGRGRATGAAQPRNSTFGTSDSDLDGNQGTGAVRPHRRRPHFRAGHTAADSSPGERAGLPAQTFAWCNAALIDGARAQDAACGRAAPA